MVPLILGNPQLVGRVRDESRGYRASGGLGLQVQEWANGLRLGLVWLSMFFLKFSLLRMNRLLAESVFGIS